MKIVDAHLHFSDEPYFHEIARQAGHVNSEEHLRGQFKKLGISGGVVMMGPRALEQGEHELPDFLHYCVGVGHSWLQPDKIDRAQALVEQHLLWESCVGIKLYPGYEPYSVGDPLCDPLYETARRLEAPVAVHMGYTASGDTSPWCHPDTIGQAAARWPDVQFVMCHMGNPWIEDAVAVMKRHANVAADLSGILEGKAESLENLLGALEPFVSRLRAALLDLGDFDRILYGTDWPLANLTDYIGFVHSLVPAEHQRAVFCDNARRIYGLEYASQ